MSYLVGPVWWVSSAGTANLKPVCATLHTCSQFHPLDGSVVVAKSTVQFTSQQESFCKLRRAASPKRHDAAILTIEVREGEEGASSVGAAEPASCSTLRSIVHQCVSGVL